MKKLSKIFLSAILVFVLLLPLTFIGCDTNKETAKKLLSIEFVSAIKTDYIVGEALDFNESKLRLVYDDNSKILVEPDVSMVSGFSTTNVGNRNMIIEFDGVQRTIAYTVNSFKLGEYHLYYAGSEESYSEENELENPTARFILNEDGTCIIVNSTEEQSTWSYNNDGKIIIPHDYGDLTLTAVTSTCLSGSQAGHGNFYVLRFAE